MHFAIDAHAVGQRLTGNETYIRNLINEFPGLDGDSEFTAYRTGAAGPDSRRGVSSSAFRRLGFELGAAVRRDRPNLLHVQYTAPLFAPVPIVATVHDVSYLDHPEFFHPCRAAQLRATVEWTVKRAACVLAPSEFSRRAILRRYAIDPGKVIAISNGVASDFYPLDRGCAAARVARKFGIAGRFILTVGDLQPRKNHAGLLRAFECAIRATALPHHLVIAGQEGYRAEEIRRAAARSAIADRVHFTGYVCDSDLIDFYSAADLFVFPSFYEGFGLPILEAMACGCAVACSNTTAMPEVAGDAALLFDPRSVSDLTRSMVRILREPCLRERLRWAGRERAARFTWERAARLTLDAYHRAAGRSKRIHDENRVFLAAAAR